MNLFEHAFFALLAQALIVALWRRPWVGAIIPCVYFLSRELTQAEYRWIEHFGHGLRANMPWWGALDPAVWTKADQFADWIGPIVATGLAALVYRRKEREIRANRPAL